MNQVFVRYLIDGDVGKSRASRQQEKSIYQFAFVHGMYCTMHIIRLTQWLLSTGVEHSHDLLGLHTRLDKLLLCQLAVLVQVEALEQLGGAPDH